jgi:uncharacterized protein (TIGR02147 family)
MFIVLYVVMLKLDMQDFFSFTDYRELTWSLLKQKPKKGWGQLSKLAKSISVTSTLVSQILSGEKNFTPEQAAATCEFLNLTELETEYYLALVDYMRAGTPLLKGRIEQRMHNVQAQANNLKNRIDNLQELTSDSIAQFYSQWNYSAIRLLTSIPEYNTVEKIANYFSMPKNQVIQILDFLVQHGLVTKKSDQYSMGIARTYLPPQSPLVGQHHLNWRLKSLSKTNSLTSDEMMFTAPMTISKKDFDRILIVLRKQITEIFKTLEQTKPEVLANLNIDFLKY